MSPKGLPHIYLIYCNYLSDRNDRQLSIEKATVVFFQLAALYQLLATVTLRAVFVYFVLMSAAHEQHVVVRACLNIEIKNSC